MRRAALVVVALVAAAALVQPALASQGDYFWLNTSTPQLNVTQAGSAQAQQTCECAVCGAGPQSQAKEQPQKTDERTENHPGAVRTDSPWNF